LAEEELAIFDLLTKPDITLTEKEKHEIKKVAKELLLTIKKEKKRKISFRLAQATANQGSS